MLSLISINYIRYSSNHTYHLFQHVGARAELTDAQNQMETIKEKIKTKESYILELQEKIKIHQSESYDARKAEQVNYFLLYFSPFSHLDLLRFVHIFWGSILRFMYILLGKFDIGKSKTGGAIGSYGTGSKAKTHRD